MPKYYIEGGHRLQGEVRLQGAKNSALPLLAATLLVDGVSVLRNCPDLSDVHAAMRILKALGCKCEMSSGVVTVDATNVNCHKVPDELMREMRSSVVFLGAILSRCGCSEITAPGGCELGPRPIDLHLSAIEKMGYSVNETGGCILCNRVGLPEHTEITLDFPSVGATENIILAAAVSTGCVTLHNAAKEPEIKDLSDFLNKAGADISGAGTDLIVIKGVSKLRSVEHQVIPDRIAAATFMSAAAITGGCVDILGVDNRHLHQVTNAFGEMGCDITVCDDRLSISAKRPLSRIAVTRSSVYPGFPTDAGPLLVAALTRAKGSSLFIENIFENRFNYIMQLRRLGADIRLHNRVAVIDGVRKLHGAPLYCTDLRGGAAAVVAALAAEGSSTVDDIHHIERGYEHLETDLTLLGAKITKE